MKVVSAGASAVRHVLGVSAQAILIFAILAALLLTLSPIYKPAQFLAGIGAVDAGRTHAWLSLGGDARLASISTSADYTIVGGGFEPGVGVAINLAEPGCCRFFTVWPNADGQISFVAATMGPGTYEVRAYQRLNPRKLTFMASTSFDVGG